MFAGRLLFVLIVAIMLSGACSASQARDLRSNTWVATDALGRKLPDYHQSRPLRTGRYVAVVYEPWFDSESGAMYGPFNTREILQANPSDPKWGPSPSFHYWDEPEMGYYLADDPYVIRKHAQMLTDAGVDAIFVDLSNGYIYPEVVRQIIRTYKEIRQEGGRTPLVVFFLHTGELETIKRVYDSFYAPEPNSELWFRWQGKPLILCNPDGVEPRLRQFFTFRKTWGLSPIDEPDKWSFLSHYPQPWGWHTPGVPEQMAVSPAQQETYMTEPTAHGKSYHDGAEPTESQRNYRGLNFAEQWRRALEVDPQLVFISSWNEWMAQRFIDERGGSRFTDSYTEEFSRDVEPMKGGYTDCYYYEMAAYIRRFKGVRPPEKPSPPKTIRIDGKFDDWTGVRPDYLDTPGDTTHRNHLGWGYRSPGVRVRYVNSTGRNDFTRLKVARDARNTYFYAETRDKITSWRSNAWMLLFIDSDSDSSTGWQGYDILVNSPVISAGRTTVKRSTGGWNWKTVGAARFAVSGNKLELSVPLSLIGLKGKQMSFDFHWADNIRLVGDITEFAVSGDGAPNRRFNYRYSTVK